MTVKLKVAVVVLADTEAHEGMGRVANALVAVKEFKDANDDVRLIFDGTGVKWAIELTNPDHKLHGLYEGVKDRVSGVCDYCAGAFDVHDAVKACNTPLLNEYEKHPSFRKLVMSGYQVITF